MCLIRGLLLTMLVIISSALGQQDCSPTSYFCLDPAGTEFTIVGPVNMWYSNAEKRCIPSPYSKQDGCLQITKLCNSTYPDKCHGDCLAGNSVGYDLELSCRAAAPISPSSSKPEEHHEIWFAPQTSPPPYPTGPGIPHQVNY